MINVLQIHKLYAAFWTESIGALKRVNVIRQTSSYKLWVLRNIAVAINLFKHSKKVKNIHGLKTSLNKIRVYVM